jgi:hypothetical protein
VPPRRRLAVALLLAVTWTPWGGGDRVRAAGWRAPVDGAVIAPFDFEPTRPYAAGRRRGLALAARRAEPVRGACGGEVTFAGLLPGGEMGVTVRCGPLVATHLGLAGVSVRRGARVVRGERLGHALGGAVRLGARRAGERHGYVDPATLLAGGPSTAPPVALSRPRRPRRPRPSPQRRAPAPRLLPAARARPLAAVREPLRPLPLAAPAPPGGGVPLAAWAGLALLAIGVPAGGMVRRRRDGARARRLAGEPTGGPAGAGGRCR